MAGEAAAGPREDEPGRATLSVPQTVLVTAYDPAWGGEAVGALQRRGIPSLQGSTPAQALFWARRVPPALVVLDLQIRGWRQLMREVRAEGRTVIALGDEGGARADALGGGCLDAVRSDIDADELALKVASLLRHGRGSGRGRIAAGPLVVDLPAGCLRWRGAEIAASPLLLRLAAHLAAQSGCVVPTQVLLEEVWGEPWATPNKVHQAVLRLRRALGEPADSPILVGRQRHGYCFLPEAAPITAGRRLSSL